MSKKEFGMMVDPPENGADNLIIFVIGKLPVFFSRKSHRSDPQQAWPLSYIKEGMKEFSYIRIVNGSEPRTEMQAFQSKCIPDPRGAEQLP